MHQRFMSAGIIAPAAVILMLTCGADAATPTSASRSVEAETRWKLKFDFGAPYNEASAAVGPSTVFGVFDEDADANATDANGGSIFNRVVSSQTSNISPTFVAVDMSITTTTNGPSGTSYLVRDVARSDFHVAFTLDTPTDAVFDGAIAFPIVESATFGSIHFFRVGGGFDLFTHNNDHFTTPLHFDGTLQPGDYVIDAVLDLDYPNPGNDPRFISDFNALGVYLTMVPPPSCDGDIDGDGQTNVADFNILASNFGQTVAPNTNGDLTGDGQVDVADFNILAGDFGCAI